MNRVNYVTYMLLGVTNGDMSDADEDSRLDHAIVPYPNCESFDKVKIALFLPNRRKAFCMQDISHFTNYIALLLVLTELF